MFSIELFGFNFCLRLSGRSRDFNFLAGEIFLSFNEFVCKRISEKYNVEKNGVLLYYYIYLVSI